VLFSHRDKSHRKIMTYISRRRAEKYFHSLLSARTCEVVFACGGIVRENNLWLFRIFVRKKLQPLCLGPVQCRVIWSLALEELKKIYGWNSATSAGCSAENEESAVPDSAGCDHRLACFATHPV